MNEPKRFRLECGAFLMEVTGVDNGWIARVDGAGEHFKATYADESAAKEACIEAAKKILNRKSLDPPASMLHPQWI